MSASWHSPPSSALSSSSSSSSSSLQETRLSFIVRSARPNFNFKSHRSFPQIRASTGFSSSLDTGSITELDSVSRYSEIVPDTVIFDDFERFPPTAATVSSSLLLGICSLPDTMFRSAVDTALADSECYGLAGPDVRMSCFVNKALVNVGGELAKLVPGRVSTEVDTRLAYDTHGIVRKVHDLLKLYHGIDVPPRRSYHFPSFSHGFSLIFSHFLAPANSDERSPAREGFESVEKLLRWSCGSANYRSNRVRKLGFGSTGLELYREV